MKEKQITIDNLGMRLISACLPLCFVSLLSFILTAYYVINNEKRLTNLTERLATVETALNELTDDLELVQEVFDEAQKIKDHIERRSRSSSEQIKEVTYAILHCSYLNKLNPYLLLAVAETESSFYPHAVGGVGERGLVQVRYGTFQMMMKEGDFGNWRDTLQAGANYLVYLLKRFKGNTMLALAGYNAGPNRTRERLIAIGSPYVKKVATNYARMARNIETVSNLYGRDLLNSAWSGAWWT